MPALSHHDRFRQAALPSPGVERLLCLVRQIAKDDRGAFAELFERCSGPVLSGLHSQVPDRHRVAGVLAGTFVEVWWLAGCHVDPDTDVMAWIDQIVRRRVADSASPSLGVLGVRWAEGVEVELAGLLGGRPSPPL